MKLSTCTIAVGLALLLFLSHEDLGAIDQQKRDLSVERLQSGVALDGRGRLWAVVIGISSYKNVPARAQLRFANRDAVQLATFLRSPLGGAFPSSHIQLLTDQDATLSAIRTALGTWLPRSAEPEDVVYIYFAGHGVVENGQDGYLLAHDSDPQNLYATALSVAELNQILSGRLRARSVIVIADACHSGNIGWTSRGTQDEVLISRYLGELGKTGGGVVKLLASRSDEKSYEDERWDGGHGVFTHFLLEGLQGKADRDGDGVVRVGELVDYLSEVVPKETQGLQHPRVAGNMEARMPLAVVPTASVAPHRPPIAPAPLLSLELHGPAASEVYLNKSYRGRIRPDGILVVENLSPGTHELSVDPPGGETLVQNIQLSASRTILDLSSVLPKQVASRTSPLAGQIRQALLSSKVLEEGGAWSLYQQLKAASPADPQLGSIETVLSKALEEIGQTAINLYVRLSPTQIKKDTFRRGSEAFAHLKALRTSDTQIEAKQLFCEGRALIEEGKDEQAIPLLQQSLKLDPRGAYSYNALGIAMERTRQEDRAMEYYRRAEDLAPHWVVPGLHLAFLFQQKGRLDKAEQEYLKVLEVSPEEPLARVGIIRLLRERGELARAEKEATRFLAVAPGYAQAYAELGMIYEASRQYAKAAEAFDAYLKLAPDSPDHEQIRTLAERDRKLSSREPPSLRRNAPAN